jgi:ectoine hydroxylase-related dioxygenase (phytanoyl-CoA dioxygenase family)
MSVDASSCQVPREDVAAYRDRGYWISPKLFSDEQIDRLRRAFERMFHGDFDGDGWSYEDEFAKLPDDPQAVRKLTNGWWINHEVRDLVLGPQLGRVAAALMQTDAIRLWHDQVVWKPPAGGTQTKAGNIGWHQDYAYWNCTTTTNMITAWVALQDTDLANGGMRTLAGSHRSGLLEDADTFYEQDLDALAQRFAVHVGGRWVDEPCLLKAGQVSFHHPLCFHGSGPNTSRRPRLAVIAHYMPADCGYKAGRRYHRNIRFLGPCPRDGQPFDDDTYFPLLSS